jgi:hypothetical protein
LLVRLGRDFLDGTRLIHASNLEEPMYLGSERVPIDTEALKGVNGRDGRSLARGPEIARTAREELAPLRV